MSNAGGRPWPLAPGESSGDGEEGSDSGRVWTTVQATAFSDELDSWPSWM